MDDLASYYLKVIFFLFMYYRVDLREYYMQNFKQIVNIFTIISIYWYTRGIHINKSIKFLFSLYNINKIISFDSFVSSKI